MHYLMGLLVSLCMTGDATIFTSYNWLIDGDIRISGGVSRIVGDGPPVRVANLAYDQEVILYDRSSDTFASLGSEENNQSRYILYAEDGTILIQEILQGIPYRPHQIINYRDWIIGVAAETTVFAFKRNDPMSLRTIELAHSVGGLCFIPAFRRLYFFRSGNWTEGVASGILYELGTRLSREFTMTEPVRNNIAVSFDGHLVWLANNEDGLCAMNANSPDPETWTESVDISDQALWVESIQGHTVANVFRGHHLVLAFLGEIQTTTHQLPSGMILAGYSGSVIMGPHPERILVPTLDNYGNGNGFILNLPWFRDDTDIHVVDMEVHPSVIACTN